MTFSYRAATLFFCLVFGTSVFARAQTPRLSVVVLHSGQNETTIRLAAELSALGYSAVLVLYPNQPLWTDQVRSILRDYRAVALINAASLKTRVDIWFPAPGSSGLKLTVDTVDATEQEGNFAATILKTVETLRAGLMKLDGVKSPWHGSYNGTGAEGSQGGVTSSTSTRGPMARRGELEPLVPQPGRLALMLGPAVTYGFKDFPPQWQVALSGSFGLGSFLSIALLGFAPTASITLKNDFGTARVWNGSLIAGLRLGVLPKETRLVPWAELGIGPHFTRMKGKAIAPNKNGEDRVTVLELLFRLGIRVWISPRVGIEGALHLGDCLPKPIVIVGEQETSFSRPLFGGMIQLTVDLFQIE